jgi:hypothetical protein
LLLAAAPSGARACPLRRPDHPGYPARDVPVKQHRSQFNQASL